MAAPSVNDVLTQLTASIHVAVPQTFWTPIVTQALASANRDVNQALYARGFSQADLQSWGDYFSILLQQSMYWTLITGAPLLPQPQNQNDVDALDLREWLKTATLYDAAGNRINPTPPVPLTGQPVGRGAINGGWEDVKNRDPARALGFTDPSSGRFRQW